MVDVPAKPKAASRSSLAMTRSGPAIRQWPIARSNAVSRRAHGESEEAQAEIDAVADILFGRRGHCRLNFYQVRCHGERYDIALQLFDARKAAVADLLLRYDVSSSLLHSRH